MKKKREFLTETQISSEKPVAVKHIYSSDDKTVFNDKNLKFLRQILSQKGPLTIKRISEEFENWIIVDSRSKKKSQEKSVKTIYRYLKALKDEGMVEEAGKILYKEFQEDGSTKIVSETTFGTTAKFFLLLGETILFDETEDKEILRQRISVTRFVGNVLNNQFPGRKLNEERFERFLINMYEINNQEMIKNMESTTTENIEMAINENLGEPVRKYLLDFVMWLGLIIAKKDELYEEISKCYE